MKLGTCFGNIQFFYNLNQEKPNIDKHIYLIN